MKRTIIHFFLLLACTTWLRAEELIIKGKVINQDGEAIPGAIITVDEWQRNKTQYITDSDGRYTFSINSTATFQVTADGYTSYADDSGISGSGSIEMNIVLYNAIIFKAGKQSSIILPTAPDPSLGKYYRMDRVEGNNIIFERELHPMANVPYVFVAHNDVRIDLRGMDVTQKAGRVDIKVTPPDEELREGNVTFMGYYSTYNFDLPGSDIWSTFFSELPNIDNYEPRPLEAMHASLVYEWWLFDRTPELVFNDSEETPYRPFIEEGKVWKVGWFPGLMNTAKKLDYYYFKGDSIIDGRECKKMRCRHEAIESYGNTTPWTEYVGSFYEEGRRVYCIFPSKQDFVLLYDFASPIGAKISIYDPYLYEMDYKGSCIIKERGEMKKEDIYKGYYTAVALYQESYVNDESGGMTIHYDYDHEHLVYWLEGIGSTEPLYNVYHWDYAGNYYMGMSCTVGDEILYMNSYLIDGVTQNDSEVKKNTIDFTHIVKAQPKAPMREESTESEDEETLTGEYSLKELFVNFKALAGPYVITICDDSGTEVYRKEVQTSNVIALNTDISGYEKGEYTITVENDEEVYTAKFNIDDAVGIGRPTPDPSRQGGEKAGAVYDLSGRKIGDSSSITRHSSLPKGVYIKAGRKVVVR